MTISAVIVAKGNPKHLKDTITSCTASVSEIVILDIGLDESARSAILIMDKIKIHKIEKPVPYVELIREESKKYASGEYLLFLDPDEVVSQELMSQLLGAVGKYDYVSIPRKNIIFGKWIKHTRWYPDYQIRFFRRDKVVWPTVIHSQPEVTGQELKLEAKEENSIVHHNYESLDEYLEKLRRYTKAEARRLIDNKQNFSAVDALSKGLSEFISRYFAGEGYKDGTHGFALSILQIFYYILVWVYYWEMKKYPEEKVVVLTTGVGGFFRSGLYQVNYWTGEKKIKASTLKEKLEKIILR